MKIKVIKTELGKSANGKFGLVEITYKNLFDGKIAGKKVMAFHGAFDVLKDSKEGDVFEVKPEKDKSGSWVWTTAGVSDETIERTPMAVRSGQSTPKSTYETPEERARRQVYIIRQSSLSTAVEYLSAFNPVGAGGFPQVADVIQVANQFATYVLDVAPPRFLEDMQSDVPV